ncbi:hypothetical protein [Staphylococcus pseudintermedius]|nr:hypothetical protein [Staphylococcus pseudintermedius]
MKIGNVKELKPGEVRVGCRPENAKILKGQGHEVYVEHNAGIDSDMTNEA